MSTNRRAVLAAVIGALCAAAVPAAATTLSAPARVAYFTVGSSAGSIGTVNLGTHAYSVDVEPSDGLAGSGSALIATLTLPAGATFTAEPVFTPGAAASGWTITPVSAASGQDHVQVRLAPGNGATLAASGTVFTMSGVRLSGQGALALASAGGSIDLDGELSADATGQSLSRFSGTLAQATDVIEVAYDGADVYYPDERINIGVDRVGFSLDGSIVHTAPSSSDATSNSSAVFDAGSITIRPVAGVIDGRTGADFALDPAGDTFTTALKGTIDPGLVLDLENGHCQDTNLHLVSPQADSTVFRYTLGNVGGRLPVRLHACLYASGDVALQATPIMASTSLQVGSINVTQRHTGALKTLAYNGSVAYVPIFNPGGNTVQQSFLRVTNPGPTAGKVTIRATADDGLGIGEVSFALAPGTSRQLNSDTLQNGGVGLTGSLSPSGQGKWRLEVIGEFDGMRVQSLMRNNETGNVSNLSGEVTDSTGQVRALQTQASSSP